ncbi:MAG: hypothetical protein DI626_00430 [Micavibrio aeruginosavorus]|uniref:Mce/MlaD domain-containing protein n=1 Tax=Micavibrio aeruginosavorus TaxID=349221 RepID=A0A2W5C0Z5_9BACT|nr:MAG: hypothetical protein DI626_00430 [Micavibrio aeruginosavorus]
MEKESRYFVIGIFVCISLLGLAFFTVWLAGTHDSRNYKRYTVLFHDAVSGLKDGALVRYRGVDVGRVLTVRLSPDRNDLIKVDIEVEVNTPISASSEASLATQGMTGLVFIDLTTQPGDNTAPQRTEGEPYPTIAGKGTTLSKLFQDVPAISTQILALTEKLNKVFDDEAVDSMKETMANIEAISNSASMLLSEENIGYTTETLRNFSESSGEMTQLVQRFNQTADEIDGAVSSLNSILTDNKGNIDKFTGSGLRQITEMSLETKEMAKSIRRLADRLEQEPSRLLYQPNYRGVEIEKK